MVQRLLAEWVTLFALVVGPGLVASLLWSPFLVADRVESLFERLWPGDSVLASYLLVMVALSLPWILGAGGAMIRAPADGATVANALLDVIVSLSVAYVVGLPLLSGVGLPAIGVDWDPGGYGLRTWLLLLGGAVWYTVLLALPIFVVSIGLALPEHP